MTRPINPFTIGYIGNVTIKVRDRAGKVLEKFQVHNEGSGTLFSILVAYLTGQGQDQPRPRYLDVSNGSESLLNNRIPITARPAIIDNKHCAVFNAVVNYYNFIDASQNALDLGVIGVNSLLLYTTAEGGPVDNWLMRIGWRGNSANTSQSIVLQRGQNILIEWRVEFVNALTEDNDNVQVSDGSETEEVNQ